MRKLTVCMAAWVVVPTCKKTLIITLTKYVGYMYEERLPYDIIIV